MSDGAAFYHAHAKAIRAVFDLDYPRLSQEASDALWADTTLLGCARRSSAMEKVRSVVDCVEG